MSKFTNAHRNKPTIRWKLLTSASALALTVSSIGVARAEDTDRPQIWIELGGQLDRMDAGEAQFVPPFILATPRPTPETISPLSVGHPPRFSFGEEGKITFEPEGSDWVLSAAIRYGRSSSAQHLRQQSAYPTQPLDQTIITRYPGFGIAPVFRYALQFIDTEHRSSESHTILDFQAGKDVGIGMFGAESTSVFALGVRFAQFGSKSNVAFKSDPDAHPKYYTLAFNGLKIPVGGTYHSNAASATAKRSFHGIGPSISWSGSTPVAGNPQDGEIALDWGANAALLFGRQRAIVHHQTTARYHHGKYSRYNLPTTLYRNTPPDQVRSRSVTVPNAGGFAGLSFCYADAKISLGYRADFFFGAMDGGFDTRKSENRDFYGPFASVSVGIGD